MDIDPGTAPTPGIPTVCARQGCGNPLSQPPGGGPVRRYCSDVCRSADRRARLAGRTPAPLGVAGADGATDLGGQLAATAAVLTQLVDAVRAALSAADIEAVNAHIAQAEASAAVRVSEAERSLADERHARLAAEEAATVAEELAAEAQRQARDARALQVEETERAAAAEVEAGRRIQDAERRAAELIAEAEAAATVRIAEAEAGVRAAQERADLAEGRAQGEKAVAAAAVEQAAAARREMEDARAVTERRADVAIAQAREDAQVRVADLEARLAGERGAREAAEAKVAAGDRQLEQLRREVTTVAQHLAAVDAKATALEGERDRLVAQQERDATTLATLARTAEAAEVRAAALDAQLAELRRTMTVPPEPSVGEEA